MIPASKALAYCWLRYGIMWIHPFFAGCCAFLMDVLWAGWTKDYYPKVSMWFIFPFLCFFLCVVIKFIIYHNNQLKAFNEMEEKAASRENRGSEKLDGNLSIGIFLCSWWVWYFLIIGPIFWPSIFPNTDFHTRNFVPSD